MDKTTDGETATAADIGDVQRLIQTEIAALFQKSRKIVLDKLQTIGYTLSRRNENP